MNNALLFLLASLVVAVDARAQEVKVTLMDGSAETGRLETLSDTAVVLRGKQTSPATGVTPVATTVIPLKDVAEVERRSYAIHVGAWSGVAAGVVSSLVVLSTDDSTESTGLITLLFAGVGAGVGVAIGAVHSAVNKDGRLIYRAPTSSAVRIKPIVTPKRQGVQLALAW